VTFAALSYLLREYQYLSAEITMEIPDYYEFLQISPNADHETIHRVYRFLAGRFHPDNPKTGNPEAFFLLKEAYDVLAHPERRAEYDESRKKEAHKSPPLSTSIDFMDSINGEMNRRLVILALLYIQRRTNPYQPELSLFEVEARMGFPRDYLEFTAWYLRNKGYIDRADNSDFALTAEGADFVETNRANIPVLNKLLTAGTESPTADGVAAKALNASPAPIIVPGSGGASEVTGGTGDDRANGNNDA